MDCLTFIATMTGHLAWPVALVVLGAIFHGPISILLGKIKTLGFGGAEATFQEALDTAEEAAVTLAAEEAPAPSNQDAAAPATSAEEPARVTLADKSLRPSHQAESGAPMTAEELLPALGKFEKIALISPAAAVVDLHQDIERAVRRLATELNIPSSDGTASIYREITFRGLMPPNVYRLLSNLRELRNKAAHDGEALTVTDAVRFRESALVAAQSIANALNAMRDL